MNSSYADWLGRISEGTKLALSVKTVGVECIAIGIPVGAVTNRPHINPIVKPSKPGFGRCPCGYINNF